jgi:hypothetical protein
MNRRIFIAILGLALSLHNARADTLPPIDCPKTDGFIKGPYVPTKDSAAKIYLAVGHAMFPKLFAELRKKYPVVGVEDEGNKWLVRQSSPPPEKSSYVDKQGNQFIVVSAGGGMLHMSIDKCTGAISDMAFAR